jgi:hypothetical protein
MTGFRRFATTWLFSLAAVALLIGAAYTAWTWIEHDKSITELRHHGLTATGTVVAATMAAGVKPAKYEMQQPARYYVTYRFADTSGTSHEAMTNGTGTFYSELAVGDDIAIRYLPGDPSVSIYDRGGPTLSSTPINLIGWLLGGAAFCGFMAFTAFRRIALNPSGA